MVIEVDLQIAADSKRIWYPKELQQHDILTELYHDASSDTADVVFKVGEKEYHAHKSILSRRAKALFELCKEHEGEGPIPIPGVEEETFQKILEFVYTVKTPQIEDDEATATEMLVVADRFDCTHLKLFVESTITDKILTASNAATLFVLADSHSSALLKEAAMNLYASNPSAVKENFKGWSRVEESKRLLKELLEWVTFKFISSNNSTADKTAQNTDIDHLDVTSLREKLEEAKLEPDGSREILVERLKKHKEN